MSSATVHELDSAVDIVIKRQCFPNLSVQFTTFVLEIALFSIIGSKGRPSPVNCFYGIEPTDSPLGNKSICQLGTAAGVLGFLFQFFIIFLIFQPALLKGIRLPMPQIKMGLVGVGGLMTVLSAAAALALGAGYSGTCGAVPDCTASDSQQPCLAAVVIAFIVFLLWVFSTFGWYQEWKFGNGLKVGGSAAAASNRV